ncbi:MAG: hypothetical protein ACJASX_002865 [Limisphaerales bacterium]
MEFDSPNSGKSFGFWAADSPKAIREIRAIRGFSSSGLAVIHAAENRVN